MVSPNAVGIAEEYGDMVDEMDIAGLVTSFGGFALGGVLSEMAHKRVAPLVNQPANPSSSSGLAVSFGLKMLVAVLIGYAALQMDRGLARTFVLLFGAGAGANAAVDGWEALNSMADDFGGSSSAAPAQSRRRRPKPVPAASNRQVTRSSSSGGSSSGSSSSGGIIST